MDPKNSYSTLDTQKQINEHPADKNLPSKNPDFEAQTTNESNSNSSINNNTKNQDSLIKNNSSSVNSVNNSLKHLSLNKNNMIDKEKEFHNESDYNLNKNNFNNNKDFDITTEDPCSISSVQNSNNVNSIFLSSFKESTIKEKEEENSNSFFEYYKMFNLKCKYCKKIFDGDIIEVDYPQNKNIKLYYCPKCFDEHIYSKIINKINFKKRSSNDIKFSEPKKCSNEYKAKIIEIAVNGQKINENIISYDYGKVPESIELKITIQNNGDKSWPLDSNLGNNESYPVFFSTKDKKTGDLKIYNNFRFHKNFNDLDKLLPGEYSFILCIKFNENQEIFGNVNDMSLSIFIK